MIRKVENENRDRVEGGERKKKTGEKDEMSGEHSEAGWVVCNGGVILGVWGGGGEARVYFFDLAGRFSKCPLCARVAGLCRRRYRKEESAGGGEGGHRRTTAEIQGKAGQSIFLHKFTRRTPPFPLPCKHSLLLWFEWISG